MSSWLSALAFQLNLLVHTGLPVFFWVKPKWTTKDMPDQTGKVRSRSRTLLMEGCRGDGWKLGDWVRDL
jgi:hypothetical protein